MKLLITTQAVDLDDPILGFFHGWIAEFAKHFERIDVICLREGRHNLPAHVHVHSLGKEQFSSRILQFGRFYMYVWKFRDEYDIIFSHMNPHYIVLAGWAWFLGGKKMFFWRNHAQMNLKTRIAALFAERVFYTSPFACTRIFSHAKQMPVGIDSERFTPQEGIIRTPRSVLFLGRLSPVKRPELFAEVAALLPGNYDVHVYGDDPSGSAETEEKLNRSARGRITFHGAVINSETPAIYSAFDIYVNFTPEGSMDKTVLEAAACGALVFVSNKSFEQFVPEPCLIQNSSPQEIAHGIVRLAQLPEQEKMVYRKQLEDMVSREHSLTRLVTELTNIFKHTK